MGGKLPKGIIRRAGERFVATGSPGIVMSGEFEAHCDEFFGVWSLSISYEVFANPSFTPPVHLLSFLSHATVPKLVVRRMLAFNAVSLSHFFDSASMSVAEGNVFATTPDRGFCTCCLS